MDIIKLNKTTINMDRIWVSKITISMIKYNNY